MDNQNQEPAQVLTPTPTPILEPAPTRAAAPQYMSGSQQKPKSKVKTVLLVLLFILLLGSIGALGYEYKVTNDNLKKQSQSLAAAYVTVGKFQTIIDKNQAEKDFIAKNNNATLSRSSCGGKALLMSDVHLSDKFAVYRYLCANSSEPIQIGALKKLPDGSYEFTYGTGTATVNLNKLPSYIYDDDPTFFATYGVVRF